MGLHLGVTGVPAVHQHVLQQILELHSLDLGGASLTDALLKELLMCGHVFQTVMEQVVQLLKYSLSLQQQNQVRILQHSHMASISLHYFSCMIG